MKKVKQFFKTEDSTIQGICVCCDINKQTNIGKNAKGLTIYSPLCDSCRKRPYVRHKKDICERCGFIPEHKIQLDVHHIDSDHTNNDPTNLQTLCSNCHRLEHLQ